MYAFISGITEEVTTDTVVIDVNGIGYQLQCTASAVQSACPGEKIKLYTYQYVREDAILLFGFISKEEKTMFLRLISVSGIGPKIALQMLSSVSARELAVILVSGDANELTKVPGVGKKTAQRLILELREKVDNDELLPQNVTTAAGSIANDAIYALAALGYPAAAASKAVEAIAPSCKTTEEIIKAVLKSMDRSR